MTCRLSILYAFYDHRIQTAELYLASKSDRSAYIASYGNIASAKRSLIKYRMLLKY